MVNGAPVIPMLFIFKALNDLYEEFASQSGIVCSQQETVY
jgi:hypothetical protein